MVLHILKFLQFFASFSFRMAPVLPWLGPKVPVLKVPGIKVPGLKVSGPKLFGHIYQKKYLPNVQKEGGGGRRVKGVLNNV